MYENQSRDVGAMFKVADILAHREDVDVDTLEVFLKLLEILHCQVVSRRKQAAAKAGE